MSEGTLTWKSTWQSTDSLSSESISTSHTSPSSVLITTSTASMSSWVAQVTVYVTSTRSDSQPVTSISPLILLILNGASDSRDAVTVSAVTISSANDVHEKRIRNAGSANFIWSPPTGCLQIL